MSRITARRYRILSNITHKRLVPSGNFCGCLNPIIKLKVSGSSIVCVNIELATVSFHRANNVSEQKEGGCKTCLICELWCTTTKVTFYRYGARVE